MIPFPIFIPSGSTSGTEYMFPHWVTGALIVGMFTVIAGLVLFMACLILDLAFDRDAELLFKIASITTLGGAALVLIMLPIMFITGEPV